jgi:hypothetical protein
MVYFSCCSCRHLAGFHFVLVISSPSSPRIRILAVCLCIMRQPSVSHITYLKLCKYMRVYVLNGPWFETLWRLGDSPILFNLYSEYLITEALEWRLQNSKTSTSNCEICRWPATGQERNGATGRDGETVLNWKILWSGNERGRKLR